MHVLWFVWFLWLSGWGFVVCGGFGVFGFVWCLWLGVFTIFIAGLVKWVFEDFFLWSVVL